jgi:hypothetical protein
MKKGATIAISIIIYLAMALAAFIVWKFGILDMMIGAIGGVGYQIDTTSYDICIGLKEKTSFGDLLTDNDDDGLPDYICDTCVCRDGSPGNEYGICAQFEGDGVVTRSKLGEFLYISALRGFYGGKRDLDDDETYGCDHHKEKSNSENRWCSTNNADLQYSDTDNDFLPDICDLEPAIFNEPNNLRCYEGPIFARDLTTIAEGENKRYLESSKPVPLAVVFKQPIEKTGLGVANEGGQKTFQCVVAYCTIKNDEIYSGIKIYKDYCIKGKGSDVNHPSEFWISKFPPPSE